MIISDNCPLHYRLDKLSKNILCVEMGSFTILIWKLTVSKEMLDKASRLHWSEKDYINIIWITVVFISAAYLLHISKEILKLSNR